MSESGSNQIPMVMLGDCCQIVSGSTPRTDNPSYWNGDIPWITPKDISDADDIHISKGAKSITKEGYESCSTSLIPKGSILFSSRAPIGLTAIAATELCTNQGFKNLVPKSNVDSKYLYYAMKKIAPYIASKGRGATFKEVSKEQMVKFAIPLPSLPEQRRIATILDKADAIRRKRRQAIDLMNDFLRSVFLEMFGDGQSSKIAKRKLSEVCNKITDGTHQSPKFVEKGIPFLFISNIVDGSIDFDTKKFIDEKTYRQLTKNTPIDNGDILYSTVGSYGVAVLVNTDKKFSFQRHIGHIKPNFELVDPIFLCAQLNSPFIRQQADRRARGVAQKTLNLSEIREFEVLLPDRERQRKFIEIWIKQGDALLELKNSLKQVEQLTASLTASFFV